MSEEELERPPGDPFLHLNSWGADSIIRGGGKNQYQNVNHSRDIDWYRQIINLTRQARKDMKKKLSCTARRNTLTSLSFSPYPIRPLPPLAEKLIGDLQGYYSRISLYSTGSCQVLKEKDSESHSHGRTE